MKEFKGKIKKLERNIFIWTLAINRDGVKIKAMRPHDIMNYARSRDD